MCNRFELSAHRRINLNRPTVVLPAAVVPSKNSTGALQRRNALYLSDRRRSAIPATSQLLQHLVQLTSVKLARYLKLVIVHAQMLAQ